MQKNKFTHEISLTFEDEKEIQGTQYRYKKRLRNHSSRNYTVVETRYI